MLERIVFLVFSIQAGRALPSTSGYISSFTQTPDGVLAPDIRVSFSCQVTVNRVWWEVGGVRIEESTSDDEFDITTATGISSLSTLAKGNRNDTEVRCIAESSDPIPNRESCATRILIAAPPLSPYLRLTVYSNGSGLRAEWDRPFTMSGFPVTSYTLDVVNKTNANVTKVILNQNLSPVQIYDLMVVNTPSSCHDISFSAIATNSVGDSSSSNIATSGFPIFPQTGHVELHVEVDPVSATLAQLMLTFQVPLVCAFQTPAIYTLGIFNEDGDEIHLTAPKPAVPSIANSSVVLEVITAALMSGRAYSAELTVQHPHVPGEVFITFIGIDFSSDGTISTVTNYNDSGTQNCYSYLCILFFVLLSYYVTV